MPHNTRKFNATYRTSGDVFNDGKAMTLQPRWDSPTLSAAYFSRDFLEAFAASTAPANGPGGSWGRGTCKHYRELDDGLKLRFCKSSKFCSWDKNHGVPWGQTLPMSYWNKTYSIDDKVFGWESIVTHEESLLKAVKKAVANRSMAVQPWFVWADDTAPAATAPNTAATAPTTAAAATAPNTAAAATAPNTAAAATAPNTEAAATATPYRTSGVASSSGAPAPGYATYATLGRGNPPPPTPVPYVKLPPPTPATLVRTLLYDSNLAQL